MFYKKKIRELENRIEKLEKRLEETPESTKACIDIDGKALIKPIINLIKSNERARDTY
ncbi:hypothetical protein [Fictibacillus sp. JL2B1089]|uniref:hypothetical protein n=1 Tax=Fictibacillus sp. JL2B1089 TaxID=3399565 RepID=UPI003A8BAE0D